MYTHLDFIFILQSTSVCIFVSFQIMDMLTDYNAQYATLLVKKIHNVSVYMGHSYNQPLCIGTVWVY